MQPTYELPEHIRQNYVFVKWLPNHGWCGVHQLLFHWTIHTGLNDFGYEDRWCIDTKEHAIEALTEWGGHGEPKYWHKHPSSGRRRSITTGIVWNEEEKEPHRS